MQSSVRICGVDYSPCELVEKGGVEGIKTPDKTFWLWPVCDDDGHKGNPLPPVLPREIWPVTNQLPDLTTQFPDTVRRHFELRRGYFERTDTLDKYLRDKPDFSNLPTDEEFNRGRKLILAQILDEFRQTGSARFEVWRQHGTQAIADQHGYLGDVSETEIERDGTERRVSRHCSVAMTLGLQLKQVRWPHQGFDTAWRLADKLISTFRFVMYYDNAPGKRWIYLEAMTEVATPQPPLRCCAEQVQVKKTELAAPDLERLEMLTKQTSEVLKEVQAVKQTTLATKVGVSELVGRKRQKNREAHTPVAKAKALWRGKETELAAVARHGRKFLNRDWKKVGIKRGKLTFAIGQMASEWGRKYKGQSLEGFLRGKKPGWLRRILLKDDWHKERPYRN